MDSVTKLLQEKYSEKVEFKFNTEVKTVNKHSVETEDGTIYIGQNVLVAAGIASGEHFDNESITTIQEVNYFVLDNNQGLPSNLVEFPEKGLQIFASLDGDDFSKYKLYFRDRNLPSMMKYLKSRMPSKLKSIQSVFPMSFPVVPTKHREFQYKTNKNGIHYGYGFSGTGFKYFPLHGKIIFDGLVKKQNQTYIPSKYQKSQ